ALLLVLSGAAADAQLHVSEVTPVVRHPHHFTDLRVADVDGDGDDDLLVHGSRNSFSAWCENLGDGTYSDPVPIVVSPRVFNHSTPHFADLEGDGFPDLLTGEGELVLWNRAGV